MIVAFRFVYLNENNNLIYFLDFYAKKSALKYFIFKKDKHITLYIQGGEEEVLKFSDEAMALIPNSIFLAKSSVEVVEKYEQMEFDLKNIKFSNITPFVIKQYTENNIPVVNETGILSQISLFKDGEFIKIDKSNFNEMIEYCFLLLFHYQTIKLRNLQFEFELKSGLDFDDSSFVMPCSLKSLSKVFIADEKLLIALAGFEKPIINFKTSAIFRKNHSEIPMFYDVKSAKDLFIFALLQKLFQNDISFVSVKLKDKTIKPFKVSVLQDSLLVINHSEYITKEKQQLIQSKKDKNLTLFALICDELDILEKNIVRIFLSKNYDDKIISYKNNNEFFMLDIKIPASYDELKKDITSDSTGKKLFENFIKKYEFPKGDIDKMANFYTLFGIASKFLFNKDAKYLLDCANDFVGTKGIKIDYNINNKNEFDIAKFIRTGMSYKLAGVDDKVLSYGYVSSLCYFISDYLDVLKEEFDFSDVVLHGSLFEERKMTNLLLKQTARLHNAKFSSQYGLEVY